MTQKRLMMAGNWKMFKTRSAVASFVQEVATQWKAEFNTVDAVVCPSFTLLETALHQVTTAGIGLQVAAQTMESHNDGAYTGEVSALQLNDLGVQAVVLGHSERRQYFNETDAGVNAKTHQALAHNLLPIVCVGETLDERQANQTDAVVTTQTEAALAGLTAEQIATVVIAYEPVWAIGTGKVCEADEANRVCGVIRSCVARLTNASVASQLRILYGGSMKPDNAPQLLAQSDIDGGLVGGASLEATSYVQLLSIASQAKQATSV